MIQITIFHTEEELQKLTGLNHKQLWDNDFDLDDWDWGFVSDTDYTQLSYEDTPRAMDHILWWMSEYCCGYRHTEWCGKHYYILYHA